MRRRSWLGGWRSSSSGQDLHYIRDRPGTVRAVPTRETTTSTTRPWLTRGVGGIGTASFLADVVHEVPTSLMASFVTSTLGAPAVALGLIEGISEGLAGGRPVRRRRAGR
jgi:hypothetical protein